MLWTAPSWSWASRNWPVSFDDSYTSSLFEHKSIEFCELVSTECVLAGESKTGQITSGYLKLRGPMMDATVVMDRAGDNSPPFLKIQGHELKDALAIGPRGFIWLDEYYNESVLSGGVYVVRVIQYKPKNLLLILIRVKVSDGEYVFTRIGTAGYEGGDGKENSINWPDELTGITII